MGQAIQYIFVIFKCVCMFQTFMNAYTHTHYIYVKALKNSKNVYSSHLYLGQCRQIDDGRKYIDEFNNFTNCHCILVSMLWRIYNQWNTCGNIII